VQSEEQLINSINKTGESYTHIKEI